MGFFVWKKFHAVVQKSITTLNMDLLQEKFITKFELSGDPDKDYVIIDTRKITYPLFVFQNHGGSVNDFDLYQGESGPVTLENRLIENPLHNSQSNLDCFIIKQDGLPELLIYLQIPFSHLHQP